MSTLENLWQIVDNCPNCKSNNNKLQHILGNGQIKNPKFCFVFINPTHRNISSNPNYKGQRYPFLGTKEVWKVFVNSNLLEKELLNKIQNWNQKTITYVLNELKNQSYYLTNIVKCTKPNADLPNKKEIINHSTLFQEELSIVDPELIITFGILPFQSLTNQTIKLKDHLELQRNSKSLVTYNSIPIKNKIYKVFPCYFPVGRGNPKLATELLITLQKKISKN